MAIDQKKQTANIGAGRPGPGRKKGVPNKTTQLVKDMVTTALEKAGGAKYLQRQADENPAAFMTLVGKVIPLQITGGAEPIKIEIIRRIVGGK